MLEIKGLSKTYLTKGAPPVHALRDVSVKLEHTGMVFVLGKSGSGKSTFLNVVGGLDKYDSGEIIIKGKSSTDFKGSDFDSYRNTYLGFVFQEYNLINEFSVGRNIALAMELQNRKATDKDIADILALVDLAGLADRMPLQISGGQRQRVAIARALVKDPEIIMADEPTGALDSVTGAAIFQTLQNLAKTRLVLIVSHDREFAERYGDRIIEFSDGRIISDMIKKEEGFTEILDGGEVEKVEEIIDATIKAGLSEDHVAILNKLLEEKRTEHATQKKRKKSTFIKTEEDLLDLKRGNDKPFRLIKSRLPQKNALKMARSSMRHKKVRLVFSIILSVVAVTLFGFSHVVGGFSARDPIRGLIRDNDYTHLIAKKSIRVEGSIFDSSIESDLSFSTKELADIEEITGGAKATYIETGEMLNSQSQAVIPEDANSEYYYGMIRGLVGCDDYSGLGLDVPKEYGRYPVADNEILITNFMAEYFLIYGMTYYEDGQEKTLTPTKINDILSYNIKLNSKGGQLYRIVGIINLPIERYADLKLKSTQKNASKTLVSEFNKRKNLDISFVYGTSSLTEYNSSPDYSYVAVFDLDQISEIQGYDKTSNPAFTRLSRFSSFSTNNENITYLGKDGSTVFSLPGEGQIIINIAEYNKTIDVMNGAFDYNKNYSVSSGQLAAEAERLGLFSGSVNIDVFEDTFWNNGKNYELFSGEFEVVGVTGTASREWTYSPYAAVGILCDEDYDTVVSEVKNEALFVYLKNDAVANEFTAKYLGDFSTGVNGIAVHYGITLPFSDDVYLMATLFSVFAVVFFWISMVMCVFSALLLLNFITASVTHKKKEIGILRAIGARRIDVISIFLWEGTLIGAVVQAISTIFVFVAIVLFNNLIGAMVGLPFTMLTFGILPLIFMMLVCFGTIALATILPTRRVASLKPMDAIRSL